MSAFARVFVFDASAGAGVIGLAASDGSYTSPPMDGTRGDRVDISFETVQGVLSASTCFQLTTTTVMRPEDHNVPSAPKCP